MSTDTLPVAEASPAGQGVVDVALFAPRNEAVELLAEWNQFRPVQMAKGQDGWWRAKATLPDGTYRYRYRVKSLSWFAEGEMVEVGDPYAIEVAADSDDAIVHVRDGKRAWVEYQWQHDECPLPSNDRLVIYELHVGDFTGTPEHVGTFELAITKLDYLRDLGINAVELMPVKEFPGRQWGYSLKSLFGIEQSYGQPEDLCRFVDECHARGIRVIMDGVYNHMHMDAWMARIDYELWFHRQNPDGKELDFGPKWNYGARDESGTSPAMRYVADSIRFMVEKYHIDGIRFDCTVAIRDYEVLRQLSDAAYSKVGESKPFICIAEHVPEDASVAGRERGAPMDAAWCDNLGRRLQAAISWADISGMAPDDPEGLLQAMDPSRNGYESAYRMVTFLGNHDHKRPMEIIGEEGKVFGELAFRRMRLGHGMLLAMPGIPMLWMGTEFGMPSDEAQEPRPLEWSLLKNENNAQLVEFHRKAIMARHQIAALRSGHLQGILCDSQRMLLAWKRWNDEGSVAIVLANLADAGSDEVVLDDCAEDDGEWFDLYSGDRFEMAQGRLTMFIGPSELRLLVRHQE